MTRSRRIARSWGLPGAFQAMRHGLHYLPPLGTSLNSPAARPHEPARPDPGEDPEPPLFAGCQRVNCEAFVKRSRGLSGRPRARPGRARRHGLRSSHWGGVIPFIPVRSRSFPFVPVPLGMDGREAGNQAGFRSFPLFFP